MIVDQDKRERLDLAKGYEDAWARRTPVSTDPAYREGYEQGKEDRERKDRK